MFVRFPIILARPTSLRGSLSPDLWQKVIGRTPGGVFPRTVSPRRWKTKLWALLFLLCFWCDKPWKNTRRGRLGFALCVCVCVPVFPLCASHPGAASPAPSHPAPAPRLCLAGDDTVPRPLSALPSRLRPPVSVPASRTPAGRLCPRFISPCGPLPACSDGQDTQFGEGFLTSISLGPPG